MAFLFTMGDLVTRCQRRCDMENSSLIANAEWKAMISEVYGEFYATVAESGMRYFESTSTITATGAASYAEPADQLAFIGIDRILNTTTGQRLQLVELMVQERSLYAGRTGDAFAYDFVGTHIFLYPNPASGTYELLYVPQPPDLSVYADATTVDLVVPDGLSFLIWGVMVKALAKSEADTTLAVQEREAARARFTEWAMLRALNNPRRRAPIPSRRSYLAGEVYGWEDRLGVGWDGDW